MQAGYYEKAVDDYTVIIERGYNIEPELSAIIGRGEAYDKLEEFDLAIEDYKIGAERCNKLSMDYLDSKGVLYTSKCFPEHLIGKKYIIPRSTEIIERYGSPTTLPGTNNKTWVAYFPKGDFTIITDKNTNLIKQVLRGRKPQ